MKTRLLLPDLSNSKDGEVCWEGCEYSKCGRTDKGVSAFGQVVGLRVRSSKPKKAPHQEILETGSDETTPEENTDAVRAQDAWHYVRDELPYMQMLNRVLPPDIRVLAWCPNPPTNFSARFNCKERRYRYFFANPAYAPAPASTQNRVPGNAWLNIPAMRQAAKKLEGLHDFRNLCKVDPSKQISDFRRRIFRADVVRAPAHLESGANTGSPGGASFSKEHHVINGVREVAQSSELYCFEVQGSAFLWHQVRHMAAILFLVGQGYEQPSIVDDLLDIEKTPAKPIYDMAADTPLVLWDCIFPEASNIGQDDHDFNGSTEYEDSMQWLYVGDTAGLSMNRDSSGVEDRKYGRMSIMEDLWSIWQSRKLDELLAATLVDVVAGQGKSTNEDSREEHRDRSARVFDGSELPRTVGRYVPIMQRECLDSPDVVNARYAVRKGLAAKATSGADAPVMGD